MCCIMGDININMTCERDSKCIRDTMEIVGLQNVIKEPTCFKSELGTLIDVILTSNARRLHSVINTMSDVSDFHNLIGFSTKIKIPKKSQREIVYRSYKHFSEAAFKSDVENAPYHVADIFDELDDKYWFHERLLFNITNEHAPLKKRKPVQRPVPFMNAKLRKAQFHKSMMRNKYFRKGRTRQQWEQYRKSRNYCAKVRAQSMTTYFLERCSQSNKSENPKVFWNTMKPFITDKGRAQQNCITLEINNKIVNDPNTVAEEFNNYFCNVASEIGNPDVLTEYESIDQMCHSYRDHPSIKNIIACNSESANFDFKETTRDDVYKIMKNMNPKKSCGYDGIPPKLLKIAAEELTKPVTDLINESISSQCFPNNLKLAEVSPLYKANDNFQKKNFRPVSVLTSISKIYERIYHDQLYAYFHDIFSHMLAAYRPRHGCQHVLTNLINSWKKSLDKGDHVGAILMDLSKAFDCIPHRLLLCKLRAYGVSTKACMLLKSYLLYRNQRVKIGETRSNWEHLSKGVPQGSILGPLLFNVFLNDLFYVFTDDSILFNYADDNTLTISHKELEVVIHLLEEHSGKSLSWFHNNGMQANPVKFQGIVLSATLPQGSVQFNISNVSVVSSATVKLLGVHIDRKLSFDYHVSLICRRASHHLNAIARVAKYLDVSSRMKLYHAFIIADFQYCSAIWHYTSRENHMKLEKIHKRALRVVLNDYNASYQELLCQAKRPSLYMLRRKTLLIETFKIIHKLSPAFLHDVFQEVNNPYNVRDSCKLVQPKVRTVRFGIRTFIQISCSKVMELVARGNKKCG